VTAIDTTVALSSAQMGGLRAAGVTAVSRYIAPQSWKRITPAEYARYGPAGMQIVLNWESGATDLRGLSVAQTKAYAADAVEQARACGYPHGCWIYNSADWDVHASEWPTVSANLRAIRPIYSAGGYGLGLYAPWDALSWAQRDRLVDGFWQAGMSTSWSGGRNRNAWLGAHLRQRHSGTVAGVDCDTNDILIGAFGQAGAHLDIIPASSEDTMITLVRLASGAVYRCEAGTSIPVPSEQHLRDILWAADRGAVQVAKGSSPEWTSYGSYGPVLYTGGWNDVVFGPLPTTPAPAPAVDLDALAAKIVAGLAGQTGLTEEQVAAAVVSGLGRLHLTVGQ
jgi:hypothetical protein